MTVTSFTIYLLCLLVTPVFGQGFHVLSFGGYPWANEVFLYDVMKPDQGCQIKSLPEMAMFKPFAGFMQENLTICGGGMNRCYYFDTRSEQWKESISLNLKHSSLVTTFDNSNWTFFGGLNNIENLHFWRTGMEEFSRKKLGFNIGIGACSARLNQSHAIISKGSQFSHFFQEQDFTFAKLTEGIRRARHAACGLVANEGGNVQFVSAGGVRDNSGRLGFDTAEIYNFDENVWTEGESLSEPIYMAASVQFQNSFLLLGGQSDSEIDQSITYVFDNSEGWLQLPLILDDKVNSLGAIHLAPGKLSC